MLFNSWEFLIFFVLVYGVYCTLNVRGQNVLLLVTSYVFYGWWDWRFLGLMLMSTAIDYCAGLMMEHSDERRRKIWLWVSVGANLTSLGVFKYFNFFIDSARVALETLGFEAHLPVLSIILPVGISFYTFQTMAYTIDVYRRQMDVVRDPVLFGVYVSYFPQLVAGPIERAQNLIPQFIKPRRVTTEMITSGATLVLIGLVRKVIIADMVASEVDAAFANPAAMSSAGLVRATVLFALQIYGDFAGYSDIARGTSRMMGIELMRNFEHPYFSTSITIFWRRWHISLSSWLRDYLYVPLGGNKGPSWFVYRNLLLTMLLGGLWHGASMNFVAWGFLHGLYLAVHRQWRARVVPRLGERLVASAPYRLASWLLTLAAVGVAWVFFRARSFADARFVLGELLAPQSLGTSVLSTAWMVVIAGALLFARWLDAGTLEERFHAASPFRRGLVFAGLLFVLVLFAATDATGAFLYFQF